MRINAKNRLHYKLNNAFMFVLLIAVAILLAWLSNRYEKTFDWTSSGRHSLSVVSEDVLSKVEGPISITAYASDNQELRKIIRGFIKRYQNIKPDISLEFINPVSVPDEVRKLGITVDGELIVEYQGRKQHVKMDSETEFTNVLQRLARGSERWLTFIEGHGERDAYGQANHDLGAWVEKLSGRGFKAQPINLAEVDQIASNTSALVIASPQVTLLPGEVNKIIDYVNNGGNLFWLAEPGDLNGLEQLAETLNIEFHHGTVIDVVGQLFGVNDPTIAIATKDNYQTHTALENFSITTLFPRLVPILHDDNDNWHYEPIIVTGEHTWSETGNLNGEVSLDEKDLQGPHSMMLSLTRDIEKTEGAELLMKQQRIIISGDGDFLSNQFLGNAGNLDLGVRLINWLSHDDDLISIPANTADDLFLELSDTSKVIIILGFLIVLPLVLLGSGLYIWWRRRKQ